MLIVSKFGYPIPFIIVNKIQMNSFMLNKRITIEEITFQKIAQCTNGVPIRSNTIEYCLAKVLHGNNGYLKINDTVIITSDENPHVNFYGLRIAK